MKTTIKTLSIIIMISVFPIYGNILQSFGFIQSHKGNKNIYNPLAEEDFVVYVPDSFLMYGLDPNAAGNATFEAFGVEKGVSVVVQRFPSMGDLIQTLIAQKNNPIADVVLGIDEILIHDAKTEDILTPYTDFENENISSNLINDLDPEKYVVPMDYGPIAIIFDTEYITVAEYPRLENLTIDYLLEEFIDDFVTQNPRLSSTGLNFLLNQIVFYQEILEKDWKEFWDKAKNEIIIDDSWDYSWERVFVKKEAHMMVSYGTDPAYNAFFNYSFEKNGVVLHDEDETKYGWIQIEGAGIVKGTTQKDLAKNFIDHLLSKEIQEIIPTNNWMFPVNTAAELPPCYDYAIHPSNFTILNDFVSQNYIKENYNTWLEEWRKTVYGGLWWLWITISAAVVLIAGIVATVIYIRRQRIDLD
ncbi:MAG: thiamine ABC transporter substrate-binding protein [Asgard group archaeon]|nr:thiamine ABC transporter substrate-binding protein [Asgard group archaeon]